MTDERLLWRLDAIVGLLVLLLAFVAFDLGWPYLFPGLLVAALFVAFLGSRRVSE
ncbi:hypothetical protein [Halorussus amylolyticus]|uniref:hypothetical protein n=1 Tax=Halorussus amylolyticus TaxID=1126242 RepID=UPI00138F89A1|nr:hypothetical protein [Halorussus amylolyticus]